jgi:DNA-binding MarR family transcriptional regulator
MNDDARFEGIGLGTRLRLLLSALDGDLQALYDAMGEPFRPRFYPVVRHLRASGGDTVGGLAASTGVSQPAMTQTLAEMRARGLVATGGPGRRVRLTAEGEALCARLEPVWRAVGAAAGELDSELAVPLGATISAALARLAERPFGERVRAAMEAA